MINATTRKGDAEWSSISYSARRDDLSLGMPVLLRAAPPNRIEFTYAQDPLTRLQVEAMQMSETERSGESDGTRGMALRNPLSMLPPLVKVEFNTVQDPLLALQADDLNKTEAQRRRDNANTQQNSSGRREHRENMRHRARPPNTPAEKRQGPDRAKDNEWLEPGQMTKLRDEYFENLPRRKPSGRSRARENEPKQKAQYGRSM